MLSLALIAVVVFLFFVNSLQVKNSIHFTDQQNITSPLVTIADPSLGPTDAAITIVNFGDYQCPTCADLDSSLGALLEEYPKDLRIVWKDMPNTSAHDEALNAAVAARCAGEQKKFWDYHTLLMANQTQLGPELYTALAETLELRTGSFERCVTDQDTLPLVQRTFEEGSALSITATPTLYINGERYTGAMNTSDLRRIIDNELSQL